ncbi:MAG: helix-turn-helix transcriptional regulator [Clostridia bacterium]|nr:helix-turn-helix transcriptional regulator [Clostridia bacterium]
MQLNLGTKIRELRKRDGRTQDNLAEALGVSAQAVSRWESGGSYPDMEMIPAIANYFHVSIDELFGYSKDREERLKTILSKAEKAIGENGDMTECVEMLRAATEEFPSEYKVYMNLGAALVLLGWKKHGARSYTKDGSDYAFEDTEYNAQNLYWQEALRAYEKALTMDISSEDRDVATLQLVYHYAKMGYFDKATALASKQNSILMSREFLLSSANEGETKDKYQGEAIIEVLTALKTVIANAVSTRVSLFTKKEGVTLLIELARLYESIFSDGRCGVGHYHICGLYLKAAFLEAKFGKDTDQAFEYFKKGFEHKKVYESIRNQGEYQYTAPLVSKVTFPSENFPSFPKHFWTQNWLGVFTDDLKERIKADSRFAECFEE